MKDIPLIETCENCGNNLTLMGSIRYPEGTTWLVKRCLHCGCHPVEEIAQIVPGPSQPAPIINVTHPDRFDSCSLAELTACKIARVETICELLQIKSSRILANYPHIKARIPLNILTERQDIQYIKSLMEKLGQSGCHNYRIYKERHSAPTSTFDCADCDSDTELCRTCHDQHNFIRR